MCLNADLAPCLNCEEVFDTSDLVDCNGQSYCRKCATDNEFAQCLHCDEWKDTVSDVCGNQFCDECADRLGYQPCYECGEWLTPDEQRSDDAYTYCFNCFYEIYTFCDRCGARVSLDYAIHDDSGSYCEGCYQVEDSYDCGPEIIQTTYTRVRSTRAFGIEVETSHCPDHTDNPNRTQWGCKEDGTISGREFISAILRGDRGFEAIDEICDYAVCNNWDVDVHCGLHIHLDMRKESNEALVAIATAFQQTEKVWFALVDRNRIGNTYCYNIKWSPEDMAYWGRNLKHHAYEANRYSWFNFAAYLAHGSFEIRLHQGTLDATEIKNWVRVLLAFTDWAATYTQAEILRTFGNLDTIAKFNIIKLIWKESDLIDYYEAKANNEWSVGLTS